MRNESGKWICLIRIGQCSAVVGWIKHAVVILVEDFAGLRKRGAARRPILSLPLKLGEIAGYESFPRWLNRDSSVAYPLNIGR
jgi:hypothetical protein